MTSSASQFVELDRRFVDLFPSADKELAAMQNYLVSISGQPEGIGWVDILTRDVTVILGEAGTGKTIELRERARLLNAQGRCAFYIPLEVLAKQELSLVLGHDERSRFESWKRSTMPAWFFFDSVDEAKMRSRADFTTALSRIRVALAKPGNQNSKIILSSRISEWWGERDSGEVQELVSPNKGKLHIVQLLPLDPVRVRKYVQARGMGDEDGFLAAISDAFAWDFTRRPLDVEMLMRFWTSHGKLGTLTELLEESIETQLKSSERDHQDTLSIDRAREGAMALAAANVFCRIGTIRIPEGSAEAVGLDPLRALPSSWTSGELRSLFARPLFDSEIYGTIRIHHRRVTEFLCARWLSQRVEEGCSISTMLDLLLARDGSQLVIRRGLAPIVAWMCDSGSAFASRLRNLVLKANPEIHLEHGDPKQLPSEYKRRVLLAISKRFSGRHMLWMEASSETLARLADASIAHEVSNLLEAKSTARDLRIELLNLVRHGRLAQSLPSAFRIVRDLSEDGYLRSFAASTIASLGKDDDLRRLWKLTATEKHISNELIGILAASAYPRIVDAFQLCELLKNANPVPRYSLGLPYRLRLHFKTSLDSEEAGRLIPQLVRLGKTPPHIKAIAGDEGTSNHFYWIVEVLPTVLSIAMRSNSLATEVVENCVEALAFLRQASKDNPPFHNKEIDLDVESLKHPVVRGNYFWSRVRKVRLKQRGELHVGLLLHDHYGPIQLLKADMSWLLEDIGRRPDVEDKLLAARVIIELEGKITPGLRAAVRRLEKGTPELMAELRKIARSRRWQLVKGWWNREISWKLTSTYWWRRRFMDLRIHPSQLAEWAILLVNLRNLATGKRLDLLWRLLQQSQPENQHHWGRRDWTRLAEQRGKLIMQSVQMGCKKVSLSFVPPLLHEQANRESIPYGLPIGFAGLDLRFQHEDLKPSEMSSVEANSAIRYGLRDFNGFPDWLLRLLSFHREVAAQLLKSSLASEWVIADPQSSVGSLAHRIKYGLEHFPKDLLWDVLTPLLAKRDPASIVILQDVLTILVRCQPEREKMSILSGLANDRLRHVDFDSPSRIVWTDFQLQVDAVGGLKNLRRTLKKVRDAKAFMVGLAARLNPDSHDILPHVSHPDYLQMYALPELIKIVYEHVNPGDDIIRSDEVYTPESRDDAQAFRGFLLNALARSTDPLRNSVLDELIAMPGLRKSADYLKHLRDQAGASSVALPAWSEEEVRCFETSFETAPRNDFDLFNIALLRISDIILHVESADNSRRRELRDGDKEIELRRWLARQLSESSKGRYSVSEEEEIDGRLRTDIRLVKPGIDPVTIEVKWANRWNLSGLIGGLERQLVRDYMKEHGSHYGIYIVGVIGKKKKWESVRNKMFTFREVIRHLRARAPKASNINPAARKVEVVGIDFHDPVTDKVRKMKGWRNVRRT